MAFRFFGFRGKANADDFRVDQLELQSRGEENLKEKLAATCLRKQEQPHYGRLWKWACRPEGAKLLDTMIENLRYLLGDGSNTDTASNEFIIQLLAKACTQFHLFGLLVGFQFTTLPPENPLRVVKQAFTEYENAWEHPSSKLTFTGESSFKALGAAIGLPLGKSFKELRENGLGALAKSGKPAFFHSVDEDETFSWATRNRSRPFELSFNEQHIEFFERVFPENLLSTLIRQLENDRKLEVLRAVESGHIRHLHTSYAAAGNSLLLDIGKDLRVDRLVELVNILHRKKALDSRHLEDFIENAMNPSKPWFEGVQKLLEAEPFQNDFQNLNAQRIPPLILQLLAPAAVEEEAAAIYEKGGLKDTYSGAQSFTPTKLGKRFFPLHQRRQARMKNLVSRATKTMSLSRNATFGGLKDDSRSVCTDASFDDRLEVFEENPNPISFDDVYSMWEGSLPTIRLLLQQLFSLLDKPPMFDSLLQHISEAPFLADALLSLAFGQPWGESPDLNDSSYVKSCFSPQLLDELETKKKLAGLLAAAARLKYNNPRSTVLPQLTTAVQESLSILQEEENETWRIIVKALCSPNVDETSLELLQDVFVIPEAFYAAIVDLAAVRREGEPLHDLFNAKPKLYVKLLALHVRCQNRNMKNFNEARDALDKTALHFASLASKVHEKVSHEQEFLEKFLDKLLSRDLEDFYVNRGSQPKLDLEMFLKGIDVGADLLSTMNNQKTRKILEAMYWNRAEMEDVGALPLKLMGSVTNSKLINNIETESYEMAWQAFQDENVPTGRLAQEFLDRIREEKYPHPLIAFDALLPLITEPFENFKEECDGALEGYDNDEMDILREAAIEWMCLTKERIGVAIKPHHTQIIACLVAYEMYSEGQRAISLMRTGEGKSLVLAFFALLVHKTSKQRVLIIANNNSLRDRDMGEFFDFFKNLGVNVSNELRDDMANVVYCTLEDIQYYYAEEILMKQRIPLQDVVAVLDECDQLLVDRQPYEMQVTPSNEISKEDTESMFEAAGKSEPNPFPDHQEVFDKIKAAFKEADTKQKDKDFTFSQSYDQFFMVSNGGIDTNGWALWLEVVNFRFLSKRPSYYRASYAISAVHILKSFKYICGFTGSFGNEGEVSGRTPEERFVRDAFQMRVTYTPRFLSTCEGVKDLSGAELTRVRIFFSQDMAFHIIQQEVLKVSRTRPVLVIMPTEADAFTLKQRMDSSNFDRVQLFLPNNSMSPEQLVQTVRKATEPVETVQNIHANMNRKTTGNPTNADPVLSGFGGGLSSSNSRSKGRVIVRWLVTITSRDGARGHDYPSHPKADREGGLHIIACGFADSSREWRQWIGRTARMGAKGDVEVIGWRGLLIPDDQGEEVMEDILQAANIPVPTSEFDYPINAENAKARVFTQTILDEYDHGISEILKSKLPELEKGAAFHRLCDLVHVHHNDDSHLKEVLTDMLQDRDVTIDDIHEQIAQVQP